MRVGLNLAAPRTMFDKLPPYAQRANWAHQNSFEAFMILHSGADGLCDGLDSPVAGGAAIAFLVSYTLLSFYIANIPLIADVWHRHNLYGTLIVLSILQANSSTPYLILN